MKIVLGTRGSKLALIQAKEVAGKLDAEVEIKVIKTSADRFSCRQLDEFDGYGIFVKEIEDELLKGNIDIAVHSMKDVPTEGVKGQGSRVKGQNRDEKLIIAAITKRLSPYDALVSKDKLGLFNLPSGAKIGIGSIRRKLAISNLRPDLELIDIRGNIETRIKRVRDSLDAIIVSHAALIRLSLSPLISEIIPFDILLPAPGQGSLAIQIRLDDEKIKELIKPLNDETSELCILAERAFLKEFGSGCKSGISALAERVGDEIVIKGCIFINEKKILCSEIGKDPVEIGKNLARRIKCKT